jgi:hypothetical protein
MDGAHPHLRAWIPPSWPRRQRIFRLLGGGERASTPTTGVRVVSSGSRPDDGTPRTHAGAARNSGRLPSPPSSVSMGSGLAAAASRSGRGGGRTAPAAPLPRPSGRRGSHAWRSANDQRSRPECDLARVHRVPRARLAGRMLAASVSTARGGSGPCLLQHRSFAALPHEQGGQKNSAVVREKMVASFSWQP